MKKPQRGTHTIVSHLSHRLLQRWVPKWHEAFVDPYAGLFYERVNRNFKPVSTGFRRLLTQTRLLAVFSHALAQRPSLTYSGVTRESLDESFAGLVKYFHVPETGGWIFSVDEDGNPLDRSYDLYGHAFAIFALSHYSRVSDNPKAHTLASQALSFIDQHFRTSGLKGFVEALDDHLRPMPGKIRRHESHMHLLEACLFAADTWHDDPVFMRVADEIVDLFARGFYDAEHQRLSEYFTDDLTPLAQDGNIICEPGHYYEWIWLLKKHAARKGDGKLYDPLCLKLIEWANRYGWDGAHGGIYDELDPEGNVVTDTKRIWPFTEALKANVLMLDSVDDKIDLKENIARMVGVFNEQYMDERGFWTEWLTRDLQPATDYMPGTTPYHVYFGIMESAAVLRARGPSKSWFAWWQGAVYIFARNLSALVRAARYAIKARTQAPKMPAKSAGHD